MHGLMEFLLRYGYFVLFANVLTEQIGIPLPTTPVFLAMGALAGLGDFSFAVAVLLSVSACLCADLFWYRLGRTRGSSILNLICRISLEPDSCVSNTKNLFGKLGPYSLLFAKFVPGLNAAAAPLAGLTRMPLRKFLPFDIVGAAAFSTFYLTIGYLFRNQLERAADALSQYGGRVVMVASILLASYIGWKYLQRQRFLHGLRVARVTPEELVAMITAGEEVTIVDLRNALEMEFEGSTLPGAVWIDASEIDQRQSEIPREKEVILFCS